MLPWPGVTTRYELLDRIGVGGMAEIFRGKAVAAGGFEKPVAIKRILPHLAQQKRFVELLIAEAKVLSLLKHRNIVQIFDVGLGDDGKYFLVMEYVDGRDLGAIQRSLEATRKRIPFDLCLHVGAEICEALEHAHSARAPDGKPMSLVHRDVSPSNVLLSRAGEVKLTDFGIAKRAEQEATGQHAVRGKFAYISPEQARNEHVDPRSDVFSVAILIWELITNRRLYSGLDDMAALRAVRDPKVPRPTEADSRLPVEIDALMATALHPRLEKRPTAGQFGAQLRSLRYSLDITAGDPATELAKILETADEVVRESMSMVAQKPGRSASDMWHGVEMSEATVIRIATADEFSMRDKDGASIKKAKQVIDRFEEEETRLAALTGDQLKQLRSAGEQTHDSADLDIAPTPHPHPQRPMRTTDERTAARLPLSPEDFDSGPGPGYDESTRLVVSSRDRGARDSYDASPPTRMVPPSPKAGAPKPAVVPPSQEAFNAQPLLTVAQRDRPQMTGVREIELGNTVPARNQPARNPQPAASARNPQAPARNPQPAPPPVQAAPDELDDATRNIGPAPKPRGQTAGPPGSVAVAMGFPPPERPPSAQAVPSLVQPPKAQPPAMSQQPPPTMMGAMGAGGPQPNLPVPAATSLGLPPGPAPKPAPNPPPLALVPPGAPPPPMPAPVRDSYPVFGGQPYPPGPGMQPPGMGPPMNQQMPPHMAPHIASQLPPRAASPTQNDMFDSPHQPGGYGRPSQPQVAGFNRNQRKSGLQPWMLVVGALVMAALAFAVTRAFLG